MNYVLQNLENIYTLKNFAIDKFVKYVIIIVIERKLGVESMLKYLHSAYITGGGAL